MQTRHLVRHLGRLDRKLAGRDRFVLLMFGLAVYITLVLRFGLPWLDGYLRAEGILPNETFAFALADLYPMIAAFFALFQGALIAGTIVGFMLLDEKEAGTLQVMLTTPVPFATYLGYRVAVPTLLAWVMVLVMAYGLGQALLPLGPMLVLASGAALTAPIIALFYAIFAENKVQGFAMSKFVGLFGWTILGGWFVAEPWQWLLGLFPPFLISKAFWMAHAGADGWWLAWALGVGLQLALVYGLMQGVRRVLYR